MTLIGIQQRFREVGRIRLGELIERGGKTYPSRLGTFRLTSSDRDVLDAAASKYGGIVEKWKDGWQVTTESDRLDVMLPPSEAVKPYSLWYEKWQAGGIERRCDGTDAIIGGEDGFCVCDPEARECAPTLRVSLLLPDLPGLGTWRLETKSFNAAAELPGSLNLLATWAEQGRPTRAVLRIEQRQVKRDGQTRHYTVPVLDPVGTLNEMFVNQPQRKALPMQTNGDDLPLLPHEIESAGETDLVDTASPIEANSVGAAAHEGAAESAVHPGDVTAALPLEGDAASNAGVSRPPSEAGLGGSLPPTSAIEPSDVAGREAATGPHREETIGTTRSNSGEADPVVAHTPAGSATHDYRRGELVDLMSEKGLTLDGLEVYATLIGIPKNTRASDEQMDRLIEAVRGHGTNEPLDLGLEAAEEPPAPPPPGSPEFEALGPRKQAQAARYWLDREARHDAA